MLIGTVRRPPGLTSYVTELLDLRTDILRARCWMRHARSEHAHGEAWTRRAISILLSEGSVQRQAMY